MKGLRLGADDYVVKPFSPRELLYRVKAQVAKNPAERKRYLEQAVLLQKQAMDLRKEQTPGGGGATTPPEAAAPPATK